LKKAHANLTWFERLLSLVTRMRPGEGHAAFLFFLHAFMLLTTLQMVKAVREAFMLTRFSAEIRAYAVAVMALLLMVVVPFCGQIRRRFDGPQLLHAVTAFFVVTLLLLALLAFNGVSIAFVLYVWFGIYGVMVVAQMWAYAADSFNVKSGQRLFVVIMLGGNVGALVGAKLTNLTVEALTPVGVMVLAACALGSTLLLAKPERAAVPEESRPVPVAEPQQTRPPPRLLGGIALVLRDRYLLMIGMFVMLLNWINTTGEFILSDFVKDYANNSVAAGEDVGLFIAAFYGNFNFWVTLTSLAIQLLLVSRIFRAVGVRGALLVHPLIVTLGYGLLAFGPALGGFIPIFSLIRRIKVADNGVDYSLMNTTRQTLFLPVDRDSKYEGKMAIDTFFVRFGDFIQAVGIYVGLNLLGWTSQEFALLNLLLSLVWIALAVQMGRAYASKSVGALTNLAPAAVDPIPDLYCQPEVAFRHPVSPAAFHDADPGDVLRFKAHCEDGQALPRWLKFDSWQLIFVGKLPANAQLSELRIAVVATDMDGLKAHSTFIIRRAELQVLAQDVSQAPANVEAASSL
jgi:AAA family ATP:ADP antiporter